MLIFATAGAVINLGVLLQVRRLRRRPSAQWRVRPLSPRKKRIEQWQLIISVLTLLLVAAELIAHKLINGVFF
jgi:hypothetical protein